MKREDRFRGIIVFIFTLTILIVSRPGAGWADEGKYLFRNDKVNLSTFYAEIAPGTYISYVGDGVQGWANLSGGFILNNRYYLAGFLELSSTFSDFSTDAKSDADEEIIYATFRHAGFKLGYMHRTDRMVFWRTGLAVGLAGGYKLTNSNSLLGAIFGSWTYKARVFTLEPSFGVGFNMLTWWRLYVDLGYRIMGFSDSKIDISAGSGITLMVSLGFGNFRYR
jgi:hypothetical protein